MKNILSFLFFLLILCKLQAQVVTIKDQLSGKPLEMVAIYNKSCDVTAVTDINGKADMSAFKNIDTIYISHVTYKTKVLSYKQLEAKMFKIHMAYDLISLDQFIVSATRWEQNKSEIPQKISVIRPSDVMLHNPQTAADLLTISGDVYMQKSQMGGGSPMIRGFATNRVLITVDNVRMNTAIFRSGNVQNVISLDPFAIAKTEVIFGPGSIIYGSDAIGGVMNFYTQKPQFSDSDEVLIKVNLNGRYASANNENTGHIDINAGLKNLASFTSFTYSNYGDLRMGNNGPDDYLRPFYASRINGKDTLLANPDPLIQVPTGYDQFNIMQKFLYKPQKNWELSYNFHYSETSEYSRYDRLIRPKANGLRSAEWMYGPQKWMMNHIAVRNIHKNLLADKTSLNMAWQSFEESRIDRDFDKNTRYMRIENVEAYSVTLDLEKTIKENNKLLYGLEYVFNKVFSTGKDINIITQKEIKGASRYPNGSEWQSVAAYINYLKKFSDKLHSQIGLRYNNYAIDAHFDTSFYPLPFTDAHIKNGALIGSLGMVYMPHKTWQLSGNFSTGFRSPNIDDIGKVFDSSPGIVIVPNPTLTAEYAYNIDFGIVKRFSDYVKLELNAFYTILTDAMVRRDFVLNGLDSIMYDGEMSKVQAVQNAAYAYIQGIQAGLEVTTPIGIGFSSRFNYIVGEEELDNGAKAPMRHAPPFYGSSQLTYTNNNFLTSFYMLYNGEVPYEKMAPEQANIDYIYAKDSNGNPYTPAFCTFNFKIMYKVNEFLTASGGVENITDVRYKPYSSGLAAPGRNFIVALKAGF